MRLRKILRTEKDWGKGFTSNNGRFCLVGACGMARSNYSECDKAIRKLEEVITRKFPERAETQFSSVHDRVINFNDHPDTTFEEVCQVIEEAGV